MPAKKSVPESADGARGVWSAPEFRRLATSEAEFNPGPLGDSEGTS